MEEKGNKKGRSKMTNKLCGFAAINQADANSFFSQFGRNENPPQIFPSREMLESKCSHLERISPLSDKPIDEPSEYSVRMMLDLFQRGEALGAGKIYKVDEKGMVIER
jgi:hypothetical protein